MISMQVKGLKELDAKLLELGNAVAAVKVLAAAARKAFMPLIEDAKAMVPTDSTALRDALKIVVKKPKSGAVVQVGLQIAGPKKHSRKYYVRRLAGLEGVLNPRVRWHFIEFGAPNSPAHPFIRPAFDRNTKKMVELLKTELAAGIARAVKRKARAAAKAAG